MLMLTVNNSRRTPYPRIGLYILLLMLTVSKPRRNTVLVTMLLVLTRELPMRRWGARLRIILEFRRFYLGHWKSRASSLQKGKNRKRLKSLQWYTIACVYVLPSTCFPLMRSAMLQ